MPLTGSQAQTRGFPEGFARVKLRLAREPSHPQGSHDNGYDLVIPLDETGRIDPTLWKSHRQLRRVVHYRSGKEHDIGHMVRRSGGQWAFCYDIKGDEDDAAGYHLSDEHFLAGEYVSIAENDGSHTYRVITVEEL